MGWAQIAESKEFLRELCPEAVAGEEGEDLSVIGCIRGVIDLYTAQVSRRFAPRVNGRTLHQLCRDIRKRGLESGTLPSSEGRRMDRMWAAGIDRTDADKGALGVDLAHTAPGCSEPG